MIYSQIFDIYINKAVLEPQVSPVFEITYFCNHFNIRFDPIPVQVVCANLPKDHYVQVPWKYITDHFSKTLAKGQ